MDRLTIIQQKIFTIRQIILKCKLIEKKDAKSNHHSEAGSYSESEDN